VVATGAPESVAKNKGSFTGQYLAPLIAPRSKRKRRRAG